MGRDRIQSSTRKGIPDKASPRRRVGMQAGTHRSPGLPPLGALHHPSLRTVGLAPAADVFYDPRNRVFAKGPAGTTCDLLSCPLR